ncbi:MAG: hypothetical protein MUC56_15225 [Thermoanaerobaculales bacterium]|jgi:hypothetical protein|nr:hypothetical protein [Thermoanaerobaculales bacterium]
MDTQDRGWRSGLIRFGVALLAGCAAPAPVAEQPRPNVDPLPSWTDRDLDEAAAHGWMVVDMREDWRQVYPDEES